MARAYFKLKDTGTTFYDVTQAKGIVADRVAELELTENVRLAKAKGVIVEVDEAEGKEAVGKQEDDYKEAAKAAAAKAEGKDAGEVDLETAEAKQAIEGGVGKGDANTMNFAEGDSRKPAADFDAVKQLAKPTAELVDDIPDYSVDQLNLLKTAETAGERRKKVLSAIDAELAKKEGKTGKAALNDI